MHQYADDPSKRRVLLNNVGATRAVRRDLQRLMDSIDNASDKGSRASAIESIAIFEEDSGPNHRRFYRQLGI